ncbi:MAG: phosphotransferase enzyme family protein [Chloroflexota bacterium]
MGPIEHPRLRSWWASDTADHGRLSSDDPAVRRLLTVIDPAASASNLGGTMSLNLHVKPRGLVLRVHQPFVSRRRVIALQRVRQSLARQGLVVPVPLGHDGTTTLRCGHRWAELESYVVHKQPDATIDSYRWLFAAMGDLHHALVHLDISIPRPAVAAYAPPSSLRRWLRSTVAVARAQRDESVHAVPEQAVVLLRALQRRWVPASRLPNQFVHGDVRLGNLGLSPAGDAVYLDFGFLAMRPRVHDLAYALTFILLARHAQDSPEEFDWSIIPDLIAAYHVTAPYPLTPLERQALAPLAASVLLYPLALAGFSSTPGSQISLEKFKLPLTNWLLTHPTTMQVC